MKLIWEHLGHSPTTRWLGCVLIGAIGGAAIFAKQGRNDLSTSVLIGSGLGLLAYAPLEYYRFKRGTTKEGYVKITGMDLSLMLLYFVVIICVVGWFTA